MMILLWLPSMTLTWTSLEEVQALMHGVDPNFPISEIQQLMKLVDVDKDGFVSLDEFKRLFRQFENEKTWVAWCHRTAFV
jgi:hypothetical protein